MRRGLLLTGVWLLGVTASIALAFTAVGNVANRVAPPNVVRLTAGAVDRALGSTPTTGSARSSRPAASKPPPSTGRRASTTTTRSTPPSSPPTTNRVGPPATSSPPAPPPPTTVAASPTTSAPHDTVTTSQGGTVWTRCSGSDRIVYVAAVPKNGFERTHDIESPGGVVQWFESDNHLSKIAAECSNGVVHAEVEEERGGGGGGGGDVAPGTADVQSST